MKVYFKKTALDDILAAESYIAQKLHNKPAAKKLTAAVFHAAELLADNPYMGAPLSGKYEVETDLRFLIVAKQLVFYRVVDEHIEVTRVLDGRQDYMAILF